MVLEWLGGARAESIDELVRRKRYGRAVKLLRAELEKRKNDRRLRLRLGEILVLAGEREDGLRLLSNVADDLALSGQVAQAIAVLKKIETLDPGREEVEEKLAYLVEQRGRPFDPWKQSRDSLEDAEGRGEDGSLEIGFEPSPRAEAAVPPGSEDGPPAEPADPASAVEDVSEETLRGEILALIEETLNPLMAGSAGSPPVAGTEGGAGAARDASSSEVTPQGDEGVVDTPLFRSFTRAELVALIRGLRLLVFEPGQIIVSEGEAGASLFVLTSGAVRAYVRNDAQQQVQARRLEEGDFFGEISVLSGAPRSATVTAASRCELLELDKPTLDRIAEGHPHVRQVLQEFYDRRKDNTLETLSRSMRVPDR
jgi:hypothetical protein